MTELSSVNKPETQEAAYGNPGRSSFLEPQEPQPKSEVETWLEVMDDGCAYLVGDRAIQTDEALASLRELATDMSTLPHSEQAALEQRINTGIFDLCNNDSTRVAELAANEISVSGLELLEGTDIEEPMLWLTERIQRHPEELTRGVGLISFKEGLEIPEARGLCWLEEGSIEINVVVSDRLAEFSKDMLGSIVDHELAHHAHAQRLSLAALSAYSNVVRQEAIDPGFYTPDLEDLNYKADALMEDFAISVEYYFNFPALLATSQPLRYLYFQGIYQRYTPEVIAESQTDTYADGITNAELKAIADRHSVPRNIPIKPV